MNNPDRHFEHLNPAALNPPNTLWEKLRTICLALVVVGVVGCIIGWPMAPRQFYHSWLSSWSFCWTALMGVLFFVMLHHLVDAGWSTVVRRPAEQMLVAMPVLIVGAIPIIIGMYSGQLHRWFTADPEHDELLHKKLWYLNTTFQTIRLVIYAAAFLWLAYLFRRNSLRQDRDGAARWTISSQRWSAGGMAIYAITLSFCAFDLLMALDHHWFSTVFGVYVWSGGVVAGLCILTLITFSLQRDPLREYIGSDQIHDLGKLIFAFSVFWAYIAFSQYFLVWYGNIPEETVFYLKRWRGEDENQNGLWWIISVIMVTGRFVLPLLILMSAHAKRSRKVLGTMCVVLLFSHFLDQYWLVHPENSHHAPPLQYLWMDLSVLALLAGASGLLYVRAIRKAALFPVMDPRLVEALSAEHVEEIEHAEME